MELNCKIDHASIDICTKCQLNCPSCSTSKGVIRNGYVKEGVMPLSSFIRIIEMNPGIKHVELSNWGEIFLNPDFLAIVEYAHEHGIALYCSNGANFNYVSDIVLEGLVKYKFRNLNLSIDGATQETYIQYRRNGNLNKVFANIRKLNEYKRIYGSDYPKLSWQFIVFGHNEHEIPTIKKLCAEFDMVFNPKMNHSDFSPVKDVAFIKKETGLTYASREEYKARYKTAYKHSCYQCLCSPQVNWNGDVLGCCVNKWKGLGNAYERPLSEIMGGSLYKAMIDFLFGNGDVNESMPCYYCPNLAAIKEQPLTLQGLNKFSDYVPIALR